MSILATIGSAAIPVFRSLWGVAKSSPMLNNIKNAFIAAIADKAFKMVD